MAGETYKKIEWDLAGQHFYETGVNHGVLYTMNDLSGLTAEEKKQGAKVYAEGKAWNGLVSVSESPEGGDANAVYADNIKYLTLIGTQTFSGSLECYTYPEEFNVCIGEGSDLGEGVFMGQQDRIKFAFCYRTEIGNDETNKKGYKIHIVYGCYAGAPSRDYSTINDSPEAITMSFDFSADPITFVANSKEYNTAIVTIDSTKFTTDAAKLKLKAIEDALYGVDTDSEKSIAGSAAHVLLPNEIYAIMNEQN